MVDASGARILLCTAPPGRAEELAHLLVEEGLAACVNLVPGLRSVFRWKGAVLDEPETLLVLKTTAARAASLAARLAEHHPYEVPEVLSLAPEQGAAAWLAWLEAAASPPQPEA